MRRYLRQISAVALLVSVTAIYLNGTKIGMRGRTVSSYLSDLRYSGTEGVWNRALFGGRERWGSMQAYLRLTAEYEYRKNYGLLDGNDEVHYHREFGRMASGALRELRGHHMGNYRRQALNEVKDAIGWEELRKNRAPAMVAGVVAAAYTGRMIRYRVSPRVAFESRTQMQGRSLAQAYLGWQDTKMGASAGSSYDSESGEVAVSVRKHLTSGVSMNYDLASDNNTVGLSYSAGF